MEWFSEPFLITKGQYLLVVFGQGILCGLIVALNKR